TPVRRRDDGAEGARGLLLRRADRRHGRHRVDRQRPRPACARGRDHRQPRRPGPGGRARRVTATAKQVGGVILITLASAQFLMTLDSSVMNVSIAQVAEDVGTSVTGIQGAITAYTLVMAALMLTGAKIGALIGRKRAFSIGCVIYGCG